MARTESVWQEINGSYLTTPWAEGRNILINGTSKYLNFGSVSGVSGYGFRDNAGVMQVKNSGGSWANFGAGGGGHTIQDEGTPLTQRGNLNFVGTGVTVTDDAGNDATVVTISSGGGVGDVVGPASSTDNAIARFDSTTGKLIQNSTVLVSDTGNVTGLGTLNTHTIPGGTGTFALTSDLHTAVSVTDSTSIDLTLTGQDITAQREALTGAITAPKNSNTTSLGSFTTAELNTALSDADVATGGGTATGTNTGDQTTIVGITGTKAQFDTAVTDGNFLYVGDITQYTDELAQDAVGGIVANSTFVSLAYNDATPSVTASLSATGTPSGSTYLRGDNTWATVTGGSNTYFNDIYIDQSGGTSDTYGALSGTINGSNAVFTVSETSYATGTLKVWLNGQLLTQGSGEDWVETTPGSGTFTFNTAPATGSLITVSYQKVVTNSGTVMYARQVINTSTNVTAGSTTNTDYVYFVTGAHTVSLPAAAGNTNRYTVKNNHSANITIDTVGAENVEGAASISIAPEESVDIISNGTNWFVV